MVSAVCSWGHHTLYSMTEKIFDHVHSRHLSTEYRSILSDDMSAKSLPIYRLILGRDSDDISTDINRPACRPTPGRYFTATWLILYRHSANTTLICSALATEFYLLCSTKRGFQWPSSFLAFNSGNIHSTSITYVFEMVAV